MVELLHDSRRVASVVEACPQDNKQSADPRHRVEPACNHVQLDDIKHNAEDVDDKCERSKCEWRA